MNLKEIAENGARRLASQPKNDNGTVFAYGTIQGVSDCLATVYVNGGLLEGVPMVAGTENAKPASRCIVMTIGRLSTVIAVIGSTESEINVLWSGIYYMDAGQTAELSETISAQRTGVVLHWQEYDNVSVIDTNHNYVFIPKSHVESHEGKQVSMFLTFDKAYKVSAKAVYVYDDRIEGHKNNDIDDVSQSGIDISTRSFVLTEVLGV